MAIKSSEAVGYAVAMLCIATGMQGYVTDALTADAALALALCGVPLGLFAPVILDRSGA
ncbi:MAG: hypothetical protein AAFQ21_09295 [Pseudomonadota bacterium]